MFDKVVSHANWVIAKAVSVPLEFAANASAVSKSFLDEYTPDPSPPFLGGSLFRLP